MLHNKLRDVLNEELIRAYRDQEVGHQMAKNAEEGTPQWHRGVRQAANARRRIRQFSKQRDSL